MSREAVLPFLRRADVLPSSSTTSLESKVADHFAPNSVAAETRQFYRDLLLLRLLVHAYFLPATSQDVYQHAKYIP